MTPSEIKPGMKFGNWEVIQFSHNNKHRVKYFLCKCLVCGTERAVKGTSLIQGTSTACSKQCANSLIGQTFGQWTVLKLDKSKPRNYICRCSCGTIKSVFSGSLKQGTSKSCGCLKKKNAIERHKNNAKSHIGEKYGWLTIDDCHKENENYYYDCTCDCGSKVSVLDKRLFAGTTSSCGCMNSKANELMDGILRKERIPFKRECRFEDCKDKNYLPFDFGIYNKEEELIGLIELNGSLHYSSSGTGWDTPERLIVQQKHDYLKREFCEKNKIPFLVIPYQYFDDIEKFLKTSDFWEIVIRNLND